MGGGRPDAAYTEGGTAQVQATVPNEAAVDSPCREPLNLNFGSQGSVRKGLAMQSKRQVTRRRALSLVGALGLGSVGVAALAACGEPQVVEKIVTRTVEKTITVPVEKIVTVEVERVVEKTVTVPVEKIVTVEVERIVEKIVTVEVEKIVEVPVEKIVVKEVPSTNAEPAPAREPVEIRFVTDHTSGPRGSAMQWGLNRLAEQRPDIFVNLEPTASLIDTIAEHLIEGTAPHVALLHQSDFLYFHELGAFTEITELLPKFGVIKEDYYFIPDSYTLNGIDHSLPQPGIMTGPQFGMPFQIAISGFVANISLAESAGVMLPESEGAWTWDDWTEWDAKFTDPDAGTYGTWARDDYEFQYMPQMYSNGLKKPFDDGLTKTMFDLPEALEAWEYLINKIYVHGTSPAADQIEAISGADYYEPFAAGKIGVWPSGRVYSTGFTLPIINERFKWTLLPPVIAGRGGPPAHGWSEQPNLVTISAETDGLEEQSGALAIFLAGEEYQSQVGIERGHMPVHRAAIGAAASIAPPPEGMKWLKVYADRPDNRSLFPFSTWRDWWARHRELGRAGWMGEQSPTEALEACQAWGVKHFAEYQGLGRRKPFVSSPVYP